MLVVLLVPGTWPTSSDPPFFASQHRPSVATSPRGDTKPAPPVDRPAPQATVGVLVKLASDPDVVVASAMSLNVVDVLAEHTSPAHVVSAAFDAASLVLSE